MMWFIYYDGDYIGTVIAEDSNEDALKKAAEKFGGTWGIAEARRKRRKRL